MQKTFNFVTVQRVLGLLEALVENLYIHYQSLSTSTTSIFEIWVSCLSKLMKDEKKESAIDCISKPFQAKIFPVAMNLDLLGHS